jgi:hypothetical protein
VSKERARRRAEREALALADRARRERKARNRARRRAVARRLVPRVRLGRTGKISPRSTRAQRASVATGVAVVLILVWTLVHSLSTKIGLTAIVAVATPAVVVLTMDRRI